MKKTIIILCFIAVTLIGGVFIKSLHTESKETVYKEKTQTTEVVEKKQLTSEKEEFVEEKIDTSKEEIEKTTTNSTPSETKQEVKQEENTVNQEETNSNKNTQNNSSEINTAVKEEPEVIKTEWEKLGITKEEYENTKLFEWEEVAYSDIEQCKNTAQQINQQFGYVTNYGYVSGKYINTVGCWVKVFIDGEKYYLNEFNDYLSITQ